MTSADVETIFDEVKADVVPLIAELRDREVDDAFLREQGIESELVSVEQK